MALSLSAASRDNPPSVRLATPHFKTNTPRGAHVYLWYSGLDSDDGLKCCITVSLLSGWASMSGKEEHFKMNIFHLQTRTHVRKYSFVYLILKYQNITLFTFHIDAWRVCLSVCQCICWDVLFTGSVSPPICSQTSSQDSLHVPVHRLHSVPSRCVFTSLGMCPWYQPWLLMSAALSFSSSSSSFRSFSGGDSSRYFSLENCTGGKQNVSGGRVYTRDSSHVAVYLHRSGP